MRNYAGTCKGIFSCNGVCYFLIQLFSLQSSVFVVHFSSEFWHRNEAFPKGCSQNDCFSYCNLSFAIQLRQGCKNIFSLVSLSKSKFFTRVALVSYSCRSCHTRFIHVALLLHSCCTRVTRIWHSYCRMGQISILSQSGSLI